MRRTLVTSIAFTLVLASVGFVWPGEEKDARAVLDKAITAMGGEAKLAKHKGVTWKENGTYYGMGDGQPYTGNYAVQHPSQFRMEIEGVFTIVLNNDKGWVSGGGQVKEMTKEQLAVQQHDGKIGWMNSLLPLKDKAFQLKSLGEAKVGKAPAHVIQVTRKDYPEVKLYFDKKSGLLVRSEYRTKASDLDFKDVAMEITYSNHKDVDGVKMHHKFVLKRDGKLFVEAEMSEMKRGKLDDKVFAKPSSD